MATPRIGLFHGSEADSVRRVIRALPTLPSIVRYLDEYDDTLRSIRTSDDEWRLVWDTRTSLICLGHDDNDMRLFSKHLFAYLLSKLSCGYVSIIHTGFSQLFPYANDLFAVIRMHPVDMTSYWNRRIVAAKADEAAAIALKWVFNFMCDMVLGEFRQAHASIVTGLPFDWRDNYKGVASGESVLTVAQERGIVRYIDTVVEAVVGKPGDVSDEELATTCLLCISYQQGMRPVQICRIDVGDLRFYPGDDGKQVAHLVAYRAKKRDAKAKTPFVVKMKSDWVPLFAEYRRRRDLGPVWHDFEGSHGKLFTLSRNAIIIAIGDVIERVTGDRRTATILRHTAAQRMADGGASVEEVAEFLGHSDLDTCLVYFEASPAQAELVNEAMAASPIYSKIAEIGLTGMIDKAALLGLPSDQQIGGVPHGIPITGIGACHLGQSLCAKNPVMSCYNCRKFIPVSDADIHRQVLVDLRSVVQFFFDETRGGTQSQSYRELASTLDAIQSVIRDIEALGEVTT